jgi:hypothetical protein
MKLRRTTILQHIETLLTQDIMPIVPDDFARNDVRMAASLLAIDRSERENAVALLVEEHERLRALFAKAAGIVADAALRERLQAASACRTRDFRLTPLETETGMLRDLLVALHVHVEARKDADARELDKAIWRAIRDTERARNTAA